MALGGRWCRRSRRIAHRCTPRVAVRAVVGDRPRHHPHVPRGSAGRRCLTSASTASAASRLASLEHDAATAISAAASAPGTSSTWRRTATAASSVACSAAWPRPSSGQRRAGGARRPGARSEVAAPRAPNDPGDRARARRFVHRRGAIPAAISLAPRSRPRSASCTSHIPRTRRRRPPAGGSRRSRARGSTPRSNASTASTPRRDHRVRRRAPDGVRGRRDPRAHRARPGDPRQRRAANGAAGVVPGVRGAPARPHRHTSGRRGRRSRGDRRGGDPCTPRLATRSWSTAAESERHPVRAKCSTCATRRRGPLPRPLGRRPRDHLLPGSDTHAVHLGGDSGGHPGGGS